MSRHAAPTPEPLGDRPAVWCSTADVWQRFGPEGTNSWWCAHPGGQQYGLTWRELCVLSGEPPIPIERPVLPDLAYTTDSIPAVKL